MYQRLEWKDHVVEFPNRFKEVNLGNGLVEETPAPGEIIQQGTPQNAANFNHMEDGITNAGELAALLATETIHMNQRAADETGETILLTLTNGQQYPFNDSVKTVALKTERNHLDYTVTAEVLEYSGGCVGDIEVTEKLANGFKIAHTGSAKEVKLKVFVKGGFY